MKIKKRLIWLSKPRNLQKVCAVDAGCYCSVVVDGKRWETTYYIEVPPKN